MSDVARLLLQIDQGDSLASEQLLPLVYAELRNVAARQLRREKPGQTLDATSLVHEAYLRLTGGQNPQSWQGRNHFFAAAAESMRRILVERARRRAAQKHGSGRTRVDLNAADVLAGPQSSVDLLSLDEALNGLAAEAPLKAELVKLRYFAGCTMAEAAQALGISLATAERHWAYARSWLYAALDNGEQGSSSRDARSQPNAERKS